MQLLNKSKPTRNSSNTSRKTQASPNPTSSTQTPPSATAPAPVIQSPSLKGSTLTKTLSATSFQQTTPPKILLKTNMAIPNRNFIPPFITTRGSKIIKPSTSSKPTGKPQASCDPDDSYILKEITSFERFVIEQTIPTPLITAKSWVIMDLHSGEVLYAKRDNKRREIASLTKMMTMLCVVKLCKKFGIDPKDMYIQVTKLASTMIGTSAKLKYGDILSIWDLLHGLMLPSGNDAAYTLAESFGTYIYLQSDEYKLKVKENPEYATHKVKNPVKFFLDLMNKTAEELELTHTFYANPHGLINQHAHSTAVDQAKLAYYCWKQDYFREVCAKKTYTCEIEQIDSSTRMATWESTNKLLGKEGWYGLKTGITSAAGPCFVGTYEKGEDNYLIVLLCSASMEVRWNEAPRLINWIVDTRKKFKMYQ